MTSHERGWFTDHRIALAGLLLTFVATAAAVMVVPEFRYLIGFEKRPTPQPNKPGESYIPPSELAPYILGVDDAYHGTTTARLYQLDMKAGDIKLIKRLETGGLGLGGGGIFGNRGSMNNRCAFVADIGTSDIGAFVLPSYKLVGRYEDESVRYDPLGGGGMSLSPDGRVLYAAYSGSMNIAAWHVNLNCSLSFMAAYVPRGGRDYFSELKVSPNGKLLLVPVSSVAALESFTIQEDGTLTDEDSLNLANTRCFPASIAFTSDSAIVMLQGRQNAVCSVSVSSEGVLTNLQTWDLVNYPAISLIPIPSSLSSGSGALYIVGKRRITVANFEQVPLRFSASSTTFDFDFGYAELSIVGKALVFLQQDRVAWFEMSPDWSLRLAGETTLPESDQNLSMSLYPTSP